MLLVKRLYDIPEVVIKKGVCRDTRQLEKCLEGIAHTINVLVRCAQHQTKLTASELVARPTYVEEMENIRSNVVKAISAKNPAFENEDWDDVTHYSKIPQKNQHAQVKQSDAITPPSQKAVSSLEREEVKEEVKTKLTFETPVKTGIRFD